MSAKRLQGCDEVHSPQPKPGSIRFARSKRPEIPRLVDLEKEDTEFYAALHHRSLRIAAFIGQFFIHIVKSSSFYT